MKKHKTLYPPLIFNVFKPARMTSYDVIRHFKRNLPQGFGKIGHFGTLDPFASGVLMIGIGGAARLNDFIHEYLPKTYIAIGKLGVETPTGDYTSEIIQRDESLYLQREIASFPREFIEARIREKFVGDYWQAPHKYSAAKFMGKNLHEWAREGVEVKKEPVLRRIHQVNVIKYSFPYLILEVTVSSGTYVRTLFTDICQDLGTIGSLISLVRSRVGHVEMSRALKKGKWPFQKDVGVMDHALKVTDVLDFPRVELTERHAVGFKNGAFLRASELNIPNEVKYVWMLEHSRLLGLAERMDATFFKPKINFGSVDEAEISSVDDLL